MNFRGWFDRLPLDQKAVTTVGLTVLAWLAVGAVFAIVVLLMGVGFSFRFW